MLDTAETGLGSIGLEQNELKTAIASIDAGKFISFLSSFLGRKGIYVDPMRDVASVYFSTSLVNLDADILPGYIRQVAKNLAGK